MLFSLAIEDGRTLTLRSLRVKTGGTTTHITSIDLAIKVTDTEEKLRHTLAHELCHIAAWVLSGELKPPHGE